MFRVIRLLCLGLVSSLVMTEMGFAETYQIDRNHSTVGFSIRHFVSRVSGRFNQFSGGITYDPAAPEKTAIEATIQTNSIDTGSLRRDDHLRSADFFEVEAYSTITFKSTSAQMEGEQIMVMGDLMMHGVTKPVTMAVTVLGIGKHPQRGTPLAGFETELTLLCSDFGINSWANFANVLGDEVKVNITVEAGPPRQVREGRGSGRGSRRGGRDGN
jgi:polyisoprenoid-binding protein YceI